MANFPTGLLEWAGHRSGGVKRLFHAGSGRPSGVVIGTSLLRRLDNWAVAVATGEPETPRVVLLVGGPGNGKTEAVESTLLSLGHALGFEDALKAGLASQFNPKEGAAVPRLVNLTSPEFMAGSRPLSLTVVQDASVADARCPDRTPAALLVDDLEKATLGGQDHVYLACVNRGILDDALIHATDTGRAATKQLLETVVRAAGTSPQAPQCWPLAGYPKVAVWPMDTESLLIPPTSGEARSPAEQVLMAAISEEAWPLAGSCAAGDRCPFCRSRTTLSSEVHRQALLRILRWYELATGKRWSFRDLFSLISFLLAGSPASEASIADPCVWASKLLETRAGGANTDAAKLAAPFVLVANQYQHRLFGTWHRPSGRGIRRLLTEVKLDDDPTLVGLHYFLSRPRNTSIPATLRTQLQGICETLDPALADPDVEVPLTARTTIRFRDLDARFSRSIREGLTDLKKYHCLSPLETDLLGALATAEDRISSPIVRRRRPAIAHQLQVLVRDFSCRLVRRTIGARVGTIRERSILDAFEHVVDGDETLLHQAARQVEGLLNEREKFQVILNTTFGQPSPPENRRVVLTTEKQRVRPTKPEWDGRPPSDIRFLSVGSGATAQSIPLTYELFRSVRELRSGMYGASSVCPAAACPRYTQIGNAVPPLLVEAFGLAIRRALENCRYGIGSEHAHGRMAL